MQYYFSINGLFSNVFSADGKQIDMNETAVLGESLVSSQCHFVYHLSHSILLRSRPILRADGLLFVRLS